MKLLIALILAATVLAQCPDKDELCGECSGKTCTNCLASYLNILTGACVKATITVDNCMNYAANGFCAACSKFYVAGIDGKCTKVNNDCALNNILIGCYSCGNNIKLVNAICSSANKCTDAYCDLCQSDGVCFTCKSGYSLGLDAKCTAVSAAIANCDSVALNACASCSYGYFDKNGTCTLSTAYKSASKIIMSAVFAVIAMLI